MEELKKAVLEVRKTKKTVELENCFVCWCRSANKVVTIPK